MSSTTWIREEEMELARELAQKNLAHANAVQASVRPRASLYGTVFKRLIDVVISLVVLVITIPLNFILAVGTLISVGLPLTYKQQRIGKNQKPFTLIKFRSMTNERDENGQLLPPKQRVTRFGRFIRLTSLDEFLNFVSILKGDMSIIGPRPLPVEYAERLSNRHLCRHLVRPGLLCPMTSQIKEQYPFPEPYSRYHASFENDIWYVENASFLVDMRLFGGLVRSVFERDRRAKNAGASSPFVGYNAQGNAESWTHYKKHELRNQESAQERGEPRHERFVG